MGHLASVCWSGRHDAALQLLKGRQQLSKGLHINIDFIPSVLSTVYFPFSTFSQSSLSKSQGC